MVQSGLITLITFLLSINNNPIDNMINEIIEIKQEIKQEINQKIRENEIKRIYSNIPMNPDHIVYVINLSYEYKIDPDLVLAIIWNESNFNCNAKNKKSSARGYGQFIKSTACSLAKEIPYLKEYNHNIHAYNPYINIHMIILYLNKLINQYNGNMNKVLLSYRGVNDKKYFDLIYKRMQTIKNMKIKL